MATTAVSESEVGKARDARDACGSRVRELTARQAELAVAIDDASDAIKRCEDHRIPQLASFAKQKSKVDQELRTVTAEL